MIWEAGLLYSHSFTRTVHYTYIFLIVLMNWGNSIFRLILYKRVPKYLANLQPNPITKQVKANSNLKLNLNKDFSFKSDVLVRVNFKSGVILVDDYRWLHINVIVVYIYLFLCHFASEKGSLWWNHHWRTIYKANSYCSLFNWKELEFHAD